jgi:hypothetical protein
MGIFSYFLIFLLGSPALAGSLFTSEEPLALEIKTDFKSLISLPPDQEKIFPATINVAGQEFSAEIQPRGKMRRESCSSLPPLKLILPKGKRIAPFEEMDRDLKIVTNCFTGPVGETAKIFLYRELIQYKLLNAAGFSSFLAREAEITYRDSSGEIISQSPAFFIENIKDFSRRKGLGKNSIAPSTLDLEAELLVGQNFIENYDFFVPSREIPDGHNVKTVLNAKKQTEAMIPYDFDLSYISRGGLLPDTENIVADFHTLGPLHAKKQVLKQLVRLAAKKSELTAEVEKSLLPQEEKAFLRKWISDYAAAVKIFSAPPVRATP